MFCFCFHCFLRCPIVSDFHHAFLFQFPSYAMHFFVYVRFVFLWCFKGFQCDVGSMVFHHFVDPFVSLAFFLFLISSIFPSFSIVSLFLLAFPQCLCDMCYPLICQTRSVNPDTLSGCWESGFDPPSRI